MSEPRVHLPGRQRSVGAVIFELALIGFVLLIVVTAFDASSRARLFPLVVGLPTLAGLLLLLARDLLGRRVTVDRAVVEHAVYDPVTGEHHLPDLSHADLRQLYNAAQDEIEAEDVLPDTPEARRRQVVLALWTLGIIAIGALVNFLVAVPVGLFVILALTRQRWWITVLATIGVSAFIYVLFVVILGVRF